MKISSRRRNTIVAGALAAVAAGAVMAPAASALVPNVPAVTAQSLTTKGYTGSGDFLLMQHDFTYIGEISAKYTVSNAAGSSGEVRQLRVYDPYGNVVNSLGYAQVSGKPASGLKKSNAIKVPYSYFSKGYTLVVSEGSSTVSQKKVLQIPLVETLGGTTLDHPVGYSHDVVFFQG